MAEWPKWVQSNELKAALKKYRNAPAAKNPLTDREIEILTKHFAQHDETK